MECGLKGLIWAMNTKHEYTYLNSVGRALAGKAIRVH